MKKSNIDIEQLRRNKASSPESKLEWLYAALCFAQAKKKRSSGGKNTKKIREELFKLADPIQ